MKDLTRGRRERKMINFNLLLLWMLGALLVGLMAWVYDKSLGYCLRPLLWLSVKFNRLYLWFWSMSL